MSEQSLFVEAVSSLSSKFEFDSSHKRDIDIDRISETYYSKKGQET